MKNYITLLLLTTTAYFSLDSILAQSPEKFSYQAVIRNATGQLVSSQPVSTRIRILKGTATGTMVYAETHNAATNANGLLSFEIGSGTVASGDIAAISWEDGPYFISTETDPSGGNNYSIEITHQLLSVPYALHAKTSEMSLNDADAQTLSLSGNDLSISNGNTVTLPSASGATGNAGGDLTGTYPNPALANSAVTADKLAGNSVNNAKIVDGAVNAAKIATSAVTTDKILNLAVTSSKLEDYSVNGSKIANAAITPEKISSTGAVSGSTLLYNGTVWSFTPESFRRSNDSLTSDKHVIARAYNRAATGNANLVPIAYGKVREDGVVYPGASTSNFTVTKSNTGHYQISITGESYGFSTYLTIATLEENTDPGFIQAVSIANNLVCRTYNIAGNYFDKSFSFMVYKK